MNRIYSSFSREKPMSSHETLSASEKELFRDSVIKFLEKEVAPWYDQWERDEIWPRELGTNLGMQDSFV